MTALESRAYNAGVNEGLNRAVTAMQRALNINLKGIVTSEITRHSYPGAVLGITASAAVCANGISQAARMPSPPKEMRDMQSNAGGKGLETAAATEEPITITSDDLRRVHRSTAAGKLKRAELRRDSAIEAASVEMGEIGHCGEVKSKALVLLDCLEAHDPRAARAACEEFLRS